MMLFSSLTYTETDEQLMERFVSQEESRRHLRNFIVATLPGLKGFFIRMMSGDVALADDFLQELFLRIYEARSSYQTGKQFSTWAFAIAYNFCKNEYRHREIEEEYFSQQSHPLGKGLLCFAGV